MPNKFTPYAVVKTKTKYPSSIGDIAEAASGIAGGTYPETEQWQGRGDAMRHLVWQALMAKQYGNTLANAAGQYHELPLGAALRAADFDQTPVEKAQDLYNNALGREIASKAKNIEDIYTLAKQYVETGRAKFLTPAELEYQANLEETQNQVEQKNTPY